MIIIPAVDIKDGKCVRLSQGRMSEETIYSEDPLEMAKRWESEGAERLHIIDLNGAFIGRPYHSLLIKEIVKNLSIPVEVGGGIRDIKAIEDYLSAGVKWVILGTSALNNPKLIEIACYRFAGNVIIAVDAMKGKVFIEGWNKEGSINAIDLIKVFEGMPISSIIFTDIERDGMVSGPNYEMIKLLSEVTDIPIIASGGISRIEDIEKILEFECRRIIGVIVGKALYNGNIDLREAIKLGKRIKD